MSPEDLEEILEKAVEDGILVKEIDEETGEVLYKLNTH